MTLIDKAIVKYAIEVTKNVVDGIKVELLWRDHVATNNSHKVVDIWMGIH